MTKDEIEALAMEMEMLLHRHNIIMRRVRIDGGTSCGRPVELALDGSGIFR